MLRYGIVLQLRVRQREKSYVDFLQRLEDLLQVELLQHRSVLRSFLILLLHVLHLVEAVVDIENCDNRGNVQILTMILVMSHYRRRFHHVENPAFFHHD